MPRLVVAIGLAAVLATAGCAPGRSAGLSRPAPELAPGAGVNVPVPETAPARPLQFQDEEPAVLEVMTGLASYYANSLAGRATASGAAYDPESFIAAHRHLPFGTLLRVTNPANGRSVEVRVVDRGPFIEGRVLDLSRSAAEALDMIRQGVVPVHIEVLSYGG